MSPQDNHRQGVIVTGAEEHQGLAVVRGLGMRGVPVVACGSQPRSLAFYSRFATARHVYTSPFVDPRRFVDDILHIARTSGARLIIPSVESTLVVLDDHRTEVEQQCRLAAPATETLEVALDKLRTLELAERVGVPAPKTVHGATGRAILEAAKGLRFPVSLKPRGHALYDKTKNALGFKVKYATTLEQLEGLLEPLGKNGVYPLVQEYAPGTGVCVAAVCDGGRPIALLPYRRVREVPLTGGVSVLRRSLPPDPRLNEYVTSLLGALRWHGVAMVEFRYHAATDRYVLMEINGRFQASTALSIDAGLNLPYLVYALYSGLPLERSYPYRPGVEERWLRGDVGSLLAALVGDTARSAIADPERRLPSRPRLLLDFLRGFRPGMKYDEFRLNDPGPGLIECAEIGRAIFQFLRSRVRR
ncbi:MAG TPA: ATP-grasp domain-containing protein [Gemmatimonadales bacterium]|jgi:predicted ATP-grasp superfamily ATP-dependent carboligase|nr:ATP-grasp domain-containing protein [Gemmatimonadales bacterium]